MPHQQDREDAMLRDTYSAYDTLAASGRTASLRARILTENGYGTSPRVKSVVRLVSVLTARYNPPLNSGTRR